MEFLTADELKKVFAAADAKGAREGAMFRIQFGHALRTNEIRALTLEDVRNGKVVCERGKGSVKTIEVLRPEEQAALNRWLEARGEADGSQFLFTSRKGSCLQAWQVHHLFSQVAEAAGIDPERCHPHILKHSYARLLVEANVNLASIQVSMGHKHISSTVRYTHVSVPEAQEKSNSVLEKVLNG